MVADFEAGKTGTDVLVLDKDIFKSFDDVIDHASENSAGVSIAYGDGKIFLSGLDIADFAKGDFRSSEAARLAPDLGGAFAVQTFVSDPSLLERQVIQWIV